MISDKSRSYAVTQTQLAQFKDKLTQQGYTLPDSNIGSIMGSGVTIAYAYDPTKLNLTLTIANKPFIITNNAVWSRIDKYLAESV